MADETRDPPGPQARKPRRRPGAREALGAAAIGLAAGLVVLLVLGHRDEGGAEQIPLSPRVDKAVRSLNQAEKVNAVILSGFDGANAPALQPEQGGVVIGPENWGGLAQGEALTRAIHAGSKGTAKPLVAGVQEGGDYRAYPDLPPPEREVDIGDQQNTKLAQSWSKQMGVALRNAGFDLNLGPVADIASLDSPIADRAFSDDPTVATAMTSAAITGCVAAKIACAPSHFPGAGAETQDTDVGPATVSLSDADLANRDLVPFKAAFAADAPAVVVSNAFFAAYDPVTPGALSPEVVGTLLRDKLGFKGVAITDDLSGGAIKGGEGAAEGAVRALASGSDLLYVSDPADAAAARAAVLQAVKSGEISDERLEEAVGRVLELKRKLGLLARG